MDWSSFYSPFCRLRTKTPIRDFREFSFFLCLFYSTSCESKQLYKFFKGIFDLFIVTGVPLHCAEGRATQHRLRLPSLFDTICVFQQLSHA